MLRRDAEAAQGLVESGDARVDGVGCVLLAQKGQTASAHAQQMGCGDIAGATIVHTDQVVRGAIGIGHVAAIEQDDGNLRPLQGSRNAAVHGVFLSGQLKGSKKDSCDLLHDEGMNHLLGFFCGLTDCGGCVSPQERVGPGKCGAHHAMANGLENFSQSKLGNEEAESATGDLVWSLHVRACAGPPRDQAHSLQVEDRLGNGNSGSGEKVAEFRLTGEPVARL